MNPVKADFIGIIQRFSQALTFQKQCGNLFPVMSEASKVLMNGWGKRPRDFHPLVYEGPENASVFILDSQGGFFNGEPGKLLSKIIGAMGLSADMVLICNTDNPGAVKEKIRQVSPRVIIALGQEAGQILLGTSLCLEEIQGRFHEFQGIRVMPTYHPSFLLEKPLYKRKVWESMKRVMACAGLKNGS